MSKPRAIVIGAGIGGLVAALDLARHGLAVTVCERAPQPGGKMRQVELDGSLIDSGPTVFTMPWVFEEIFADANTAIAEHLDLHPAKLLARHAWSNGETLDLFTDIDQSAASIANFADNQEAERYLAFCAQARQVYQTLYWPFMRSQRPGLGSLISASGWRGLVDLWRIRPFESLWRRLGKCFHDPRLRQLFARYSTYCGSSPLHAPATLMLIAHVEQCGVWQVEGGMQKLAAAIASLLAAKGGEIRYDCSVSEIEIKAGRAVGIKLSSGEHLPAEVIVANADIAGLRAGLLGADAASAVTDRALGKRSLSAVTWSMLADTSGFDLAHHNVFFPDDYPREFEDIFRHGQLPARPAVYVCAQDRGPSHSQPQGRERLFMIANAPAIGDRGTIDKSAIARLEQAVFQLLEDCGLHVNSRPEHRVITTPADFEHRFPGTAGALYGSASHGWRASFTRPGARSRVRGLYLAGGSVHPGPGVPMVALSGRMAADAAAADLGLVQ